MKHIPVKEVMIPVSQAITVTPEHTLYDLFQIFETRKEKDGPPHREAIVLDQEGALAGTVTMADIFTALEPNYRKLFQRMGETAMARDQVIAAVRDFNLWSEPLRSLCDRGANVPIADILRKPKDQEFLSGEDSLEKALHACVMGAEQPMIVKEGKTVTGVLRSEDLFEVVRQHMLACTMDEKTM